MRHSDSLRPAADIGRGGRRVSRMQDLPALSLTPVCDVVPNDKGVLWRALERASRQVAEAWRAPKLDDVAREDCAAPLQALCQAIRSAERGRCALSEFPAFAPGHRLLDELRAAFLRELEQLSDRVDGSGVVRMLQAMERVKAALDEDSSQRFVGRLAERNAPSLVVEVAHDMRSPLTSILFLVGTIRAGQSGPISALQDRQLGLVYSAAFGLSTLTSDLIELAHGADRLVDAVPVPFSVAEIFTGVRDIVLPIVEEKALALHLSFPEADWRVGCPAALQRVLLNLATNALKFTGEGHVEISGRQLTRTTVEFSVRDTGRGIPPSVMASLCDAFRDSQRQGTGRFSNAGLGLSICRKLVRGMGSELRVESRPDAGTDISFTLDLPLAPRL